tara:strand:- start:52 stop:645 length:594 start_codon:yes stop_codon:yes gene_type:complete
MVTRIANSLEYKRELKREIEKLRREEHLEIFKIIRTETDKYTENNNGIFINLKNLTPETLYKIGSFVKYCKENVDNFKKVENIKRDIILQNKDTNERTINIDNEYNNYKIEEEEEVIVRQLETVIPERTEYDENYVYPKLSNKNPKLSGVSGRILKKCKTIENNTSFLKQSTNVDIEDELQEELEVNSVSDELAIEI